MSAINIDVEFSEVIYFAAVYNKRPVVESLSIRSNSSQVFTDLEVSVELFSLGDSLSEPWKQRVSTLGPVAKTWTISDFGSLKLDAALLHSLTDQRRAQLIVRVSRHDEELAVVHHDIDVLTANAWVMGSPIDSYALDLAAFVMPNHPALRPVLDDASRRLAAAGEAAGLSGYQGTQKHIDTMVECIYEAVRSLGATYVNPPASWDMNHNVGGQRIRTPGEVLGERIGTCLDTAALFASLLENVGLRPVLVLVKGHAFVGYWRQDGLAFPSPVYSTADGVNAVDTGALALFETTTVCGGLQSAPYSDAVKRGRANLDEYHTLSGEGAEAARFVDVVPARLRSGIYPVPARHVRADGTVELVEYKPQEFSINLLKEALVAEGGQTRAGLVANDAPPRVKRWKDSLLDLSLRNPLINYRFPAAASATLMLPPGSIGSIEDLLQNGHELPLLPNLFTTADGQDVALTTRNVADDRITNLLQTELVTRRTVYTNLTQDSFVSRLRRISSAAKSILDETGNNNLYLAMGMLVWEPEGKAEVRSPLILVPVTLKSSNRSRQFSLAIDQSSAVTPNFSLAEKLNKDVGLKLDKLIEPDLDDAGVDIDGLITYVRSEITKAKLEGFRVDETCTLGFFDFSTYRLWRDLSDNWPTLINNPLVAHLVNTPFLDFVDPVSDAEVTDQPSDLDDLTAILPVQSDGSQALAVRKAIAGQTFVLQGPPGTGKSQTITNLLAHALHSGKRVLFIAEKAAALNVVKDRLGEVGLASFCLDLHDKGMRPAAVRQQLSAVLDVVVTSDRVGFETAQNERARAVAPLRRYPERLHARGKFNESAYSARDKLLASTATHSVSVNAAFLSAASPEIVAEIKRNLREVADVGTNAGTAASNEWSLATLSPGALSGEMSAYIEKMVSLIYSEFTWLNTQPAARRLLEGIDAVGEISALAPLAQQSGYSIAVIDAASSAAQTAERAHALRLLDSFDASQLPVGVCPQTAHAPLSELTAAAGQASASFFIGRAKRVGVVCRRVEEYLAEGSSVAAGQLFTALGIIGEIQAQTQSLTVLARGLAGVHLPDDWNPVEPVHAGQLRAELITIERAVSFARPDATSARNRLRDLLSEGSSDEITHLGSLGTLARDLLSVLGATESSVHLWQGGATASSAWSSSIEVWHRDATERGLLKLQRWTNLLDLVSLLSKTGLDSTAQQILSGEIPFRHAEAAFEHGFLDAVFRRQLDDQNLDAFDGRTHDLAIKANGRASDLLRAITPGILGEDLLASRGFDGSVSVGAVGELKRELNRTRGGKPIRRLIKEHIHVISTITPCVLASPDSAVRFLDASLEPFDLVVFDEASQIRVPSAIGALGRARAAVVVGDSRQMPPTSVAQVSVGNDEDDEDDESFVLDEESILSESVRASVPDLMLSWHYRSEDESLIAFSNHQYYDGHLSSFPSASDSLAAKGVSFVKVNGTFQRVGLAAGKDLRTNPEEAKAIVQEIVRRLHDPALSRFSIGVVTFNKQQQELIQSLLQNLDDDLVQNALTREPGKEELQVWNLESVQGHERDIILFSIAFSKNASGTVPLQFGPLVNVGGERRLNVAVTRAKRQVIVFCSFEPGELNVAGTNSLGLRHLKAYLELAKFGAQASGAVSSQAIRPPDRHRDEVLAALVARGLHAVPDVGLSGFKVDIAITDPDDPSNRILGILLDGEAWQKRPTVGDRDVLPASLLRNKMGWPAIERIWMPTWLRDRDAEVERIVDLVATIAFEKAAASSDDEVALSRIEGSLSVPSHVQTQTVPLLASGVRSSVVAAPAQTSAADWPDIREWTASPWEMVGQPYYLDQLHDAATITHLQAFAVKIVGIEGPMAPKRFARLIGQAHGMQRVVTKRVDEILRVPMPSLVRDEEGFLFSGATGPSVYSTWSKSGAGLGRPIDEISLTELSNAMRDIARVGLGASQEELVRATAQAFGIGRVTTGIRERLEDALALGLRKGVLSLRGEYVVATEQ